MMPIITKVRTRLNIWITVAAEGNGNKHFSDQKAVDDYNGHQGFEEDGAGDLNKLPAEFISFCFCFQSGFSIDTLYCGPT